MKKITIRMMLMIILVRMVRMVRMIIMVIIMESIVWIRTVNVV